MGGTHSDRKGEDRWSYPGAMPQYGPPPAYPPTFGRDCGYGGFGGPGPSFAERKEFGPESSKFGQFGHKFRDVMLGTGYGSTPVSSGGPSASPYGAPPRYPSTYESPSCGSLPGGFGSQSGFGKSSFDKDFPLPSSYAGSGFSYPREWPASETTAWSGRYGSGTQTHSSASYVRPWNSPSPLDFSAPTYTRQAPGYDSSISNYRAPTYTRPAGGYSSFSAPTYTRTWNSAPSTFTPASSTFTPTVGYSSSTFGTPPPHRYGVTSGSPVKTFGGAIEPISLPSHTATFPPISSPIEPLGLPGPVPMPITNCLPSLAAPVTSLGCVTAPPPSISSFSAPAPALPPAPSLGSLPTGTSNCGACSAGPSTLSGLPSPSTGLPGWPGVGSQLTRVPFHQNMPNASSSLVGPSASSGGLGALPGVAGLSAGFSGALPNMSAHASNLGSSAGAIQSQSNLGLQPPVWGGQTSTASAPPGSSTSVMAGGANNFTVTGIPPNMNSMGLDNTGNLFAAPVSNVPVSFATEFGGVVPGGLNAQLGMNIPLVGLGAGFANVGAPIMNLVGGGAAPGTSVALNAAATPLTQAPLANPAFLDLNAIPWAPGSAPVAYGAVPFGATNALGAPEFGVLAAPSAGGGVTAIPAIPGLPGFPAQLGLGGLPGFILPGFDAAFATGPIQVIGHPFDGATFAPAGVGVFATLPGNAPAVTSAAPAAPTAPSGGSTLATGDPAPPMTQGAAKPAPKAPSVPVPKP